MRLYYLSAKFIAPLLQCIKEWRWLNIIWIPVLAPFLYSWEGGQGKTREIALKQCLIVKLIRKIRIDKWEFIRLSTTVRFQWKMVCMYKCDVEWGKGCDCIVLSSTKQAVSESLCFLLPLRGSSKFWIKSVSSFKTWSVDTPHVFRFILWYMLQAYRRTPSQGSKNKDGKEKTSIEVVWLALS